MLLEVGAGLHRILEQVPVFVSTSTLRCPIAAVHRAKVPCFRISRQKLEPVLISDLKPVSHDRESTGRSRARCQHMSRQHNNRWRRALRRAPIGQTRLHRCSRRSTHCCPRSSSGRNRPRTSARSRTKRCPASTTRASSSCCSRRSGVDTRPTRSRSTKRYAGSAAPAGRPDGSPASSASTTGTSPCSTSRHRKTSGAPIRRCASRRRMPRWVPARWSTAGTSSTGRGRGRRVVASPTGCSSAARSSRTASPSTSSAS